jgi:uncharacterized protein YfbU (UPF0304 family)
MTQVTSAKSTLSKFDRMRIANQFRILEKISDSDYEAKQHALNAEIFERGYTYLYSNALDSYWDEMSTEDAQEVIQILDLYRALTFSVERLAEKERGDLLERVKFPGFDGNYESSQLSFAQFFCQEMDRYKELQIENSHHSTLKSYRAQLEKWNDFGQENPLTIDQIEALLAAKKYWNK